MEGQYAEWPPAEIDTKLHTSFICTWGAKGHGTVAYGLYWGVGHILMRYGESVIVHFSQRRAIVCNIGF